MVPLKWECELLASQSLRRANNLFEGYKTGCGEQQKLFQGNCSVEGSNPRRGCATKGVALTGHNPGFHQPLVNHLGKGV